MPGEGEEKVETVMEETKGAEPAPEAVAEATPEPVVEAPTAEEQKAADEPPPTA